MKPLNKADILKVKQSKHAYDYAQGLKDEIERLQSEIKQLREEKRIDLEFNEAYTEGLKRTIKMWKEILKGKG